MRLTQRLMIQTLSKQRTPIPPPEIRSWEAAEAAGYVTFWGIDCKRKHGTLRNRSGQCVECRNLVRRVNRNGGDLDIPPPLATTAQRPVRAGLKGVERWKYNRHKYRFDRKKANRVVNFFENRVHHVEGELAGRLFKLEPWQRKILRRVFGWYRRDDGTRRFRTLYLEVPRKNGKSALASGLALYLTYEDLEPGSRVISAASDKEQAAIVFDVSRRMVRASSKMQRRLKCFSRTIVDYHTGSAFTVVSADARTKHGKNLHGIVLDEVHAQVNRELYDVLHTSKSARRQPIEILITTAGYDKNSICYELHDYAEKIEQGVIEDDSFYGVIFAAGPEDDWRRAETWHKANPNLGVSKKLEYMRSECERAQKTPGYENTFKRLDLNIWTEQDSRWLAIETWDAGKEEFDIEELKGRECYAGMDLASTQDVTAFVIAFPFPEGLVKTLVHFWIPKDTARERGKAHRVPYEDWIRDGFMMGTDGNRVDYDVIAKKILELSEIYDIREVAFDRWNATQLAGQLEGEGLVMMPMGQGFKAMNAPSKELERLVAEKKLRHSGHPVLRWMAKNVSIEQNAEGEIRPSKKKSSEKIDGIVALIMALDRVSRASGDVSVYEERGIQSV